MTLPFGKEDSIKKAYVEIGKLYYAEKGMAPDGAYAAACEKITAARAAIEANNDRIAELKAAGDGAEEPEDSDIYVVEEAVVEDVPEESAEEKEPDNQV